MADGRVWVWFLDFLQEMTQAVVRNSAPGEKPWGEGFTGDLCPSPDSPAPASPNT